MARAAVANVATPPFVAPVPMAAPLSLNVTVSPSGMAPDIGVTVAVNVTVCPANEGVPEEMTVVVVAMLFTTWFNAADALAPSLTSPE